ncbi:MAG TPA: PepSY domain-containing protein [Candidatus Acidoferrum sp.]|nr:PepSY domain-containing protein [Candidatus Acidoferrum sp.]
MKALLVLLMCNCLLAPLASGQGLLGQFADQLRKQHGGNDHNMDHMRVQHDLATPSDPQDQSSSITQRKASDLARGAYPGQVLGVRREGDHWRVRMMDGGTVYNVFVDAESGAVLRPSK